MDQEHQVEFEEGNPNSQGYSAVKYYVEPTDPKIVKWVMKYSGGLVKNSNQASYVILAVVILMVIVSIFLIFTAGPKIPPQPPTPHEQGLS